ncbi:MAG: packaged DNA stabilization protein [Aeromonadaceae bacterium]
MPEIQIPLVKGQGKSSKNADYVDLLPTNIVPIVSEAEGVPGYFRFWPGITKLADVSGVSRGSHWNTVKDSVYRVMGGKLYLEQSEVSGVPGSGRVSMAHGRTSQAVAVNGELRLYRYDGEVKTVTNWPANEVFPGETKTIQTTQHNKDGDTIKITASNEAGELTLTVTPTNGGNVKGTPLSISESQWSTGVSQSAPASGTPYITDLKVSGVKFAGATLSVTYTFNANGGNTSDISKLVWVQVTQTTTVPNPQYDFLPVGDVCRIRGRYVFAQAGTDTFWLTSLDDESKPDLTAPAYRAENMPDGILAMREYRDFILAFGSSTIEFFSLTGNADNLVQFASSYMVPVGIAGQFCLTEFMESFAFITSPARGQVIVAVMGQGVYNQISDRNTNKILAGYSKGELAGSFVESLKTEDNQFLILHLPRHTLVYNATSQLWNTIKTGLDDGVHRAVDYRNEGGVVTCGDKLAGFLGKQDLATSAQYGEDQEIILYSPLINYERGLMFDMQLTANSGLASEVRRIFVSCTADGINYGPERPIEFDGPWQWLRRAIIRKVGQIVIRLGFKLRIVGATPCTLSNLKARIE